METRSISFREAGLMDPGKEIWGPKRESNSAYSKKCLELLNKEANQHPNYRVNMSVDHRSQRVTFEYYPRDFEFEAKMRTVERIMFKADMDKAKRFWQGKGR